MSDYINEPITETINTLLGNTSEPFEDEAAVLDYFDMVQLEQLFGGKIDYTTEHLEAVAEWIIDNPTEYPGVAA